MPTPKQVIELGLSQVGVTEYPPNSNNVLYNNFFYGRQVQDGVPDKNSKYPWCAVFLWWLFSQFKPCLIKKTASCIELAEWFKENGQWIEPGNQIPGDVVFYKFDTNNKWTNHTGLCVEVCGPNDINALEGNTSIGNDCNGGAVRLRHRTSNIVGYGRPKYDQDPVIKPKGNYIYGVDVNEKQGKIDFVKIKAAGISFVCMRSTKKSGNPDPFFERNYAECVAKGLDYSCFKYAYAKTHDAARVEADGVINLLKDRKMPIWYDLEDDTLIPLGKDGIEGITLAFAGECKEAGFEVGIYCDQRWYNNYTSDYLKKKFKFWVARYGPNNGMINEDYPVSAQNLAAWQYTSKGHVDGIDTEVDRDVLM